MLFNFIRSSRGKTTAIKIKIVAALLEGGSGKGDKASIRGTRKLLHLDLGSGYTGVSIHKNVLGLYLRLMHILYTCT